MKEMKFFTRDEATLLERRLRHEIMDTASSNMDATKVNLERLKAVICRLIDELASQTGSESFQLPEADFYWTIPAEMKLVGDGQQPSTFHVGRLRDDWEMIQTIADQPRDQVMTPYSLTEVAPLLDYMGRSVLETSGPA